MGLQALRPEARVQTTPLWDSLGHFHPLSVLSLSCGPKFPCWPPICFPLKPILVPDPLLGFPCLLPNRQPGRPWASPTVLQASPCKGRGGRLSGDLCPFPPELSPLEERCLSSAFCTAQSCYVSRSTPSVCLNGRLLCAWSCCVSDVPRPHFCPFLLIA